MTAKNVKDVRQFVKSLRNQGYAVTLNKSGHYRVWDPEKQITGFLPSTPSDRRSLLNAKSQLKHRGFVLDKAS